MQKTFGLSTRDIMWKETWIDLCMKMRDLPYYEYDDNDSKEEEEVIQGTNEILKQKFAKYIKQPEQ
jgi:hypothetical protein